MNTRTMLGLGGVAVGGAALGASAMKAVVEADELDEALRLPTPPGRFTDDMTADLPDPVRRYFRHALVDGAPLARTVHLELSGSMKPSPKLGRLTLHAEERLAPLHGLVWRAGTRVGPVPLGIIDWYYRSASRMRGAVMGVFPVFSSNDANETRAARHRVAAESVWVPGALLGREQVTWTALSDERIVCEQIFDGESIRLEIGVEASGAVEEVTMHRHGDIGVPDWQLIPYGYRVEAEGTFAGTTIPTHVRGGWWYGTDRYDPDAASSFVVEAAQFG